MIACKKGEESLVRLTVSKGCDVNAKDGVFSYLTYFLAVVFEFLQDEKTALYYAATNCHEQIALYLIRECHANENETYEVN